MSKKNLLYAIFFVLTPSVIFTTLFFADKSPSSIKSLEKREFTEKLIGERSIKIKEEETTVLLVGDIMLSRNVGNAMKKANDPNLPFAKVTDLLSSTDFNFGNLESPFSESDFITPSGSLVFNTPRSFINGLVLNNFKVLSIANNHALDQGLEGLKFTRQLLSGSGISAIGAGENKEQAWEGTIINSGGLKIGFLAASYSSVNDGGRNRNEFVARIDEFENLKSRIENLKSQSDFIIVSMHAGTEYVHKPNQAQIDFAYKAVDFGANIVVGHHPHWIQSIEKYGSGLIFYSLGNFIFDQEWSKKTKQGLAVKLNIAKNGLTQAELIPIKLEHYCCAVVADEQESAEILKYINVTSTKIKIK